MSKTKKSPKAKSKAKAKLKKKAKKEKAKQRAAKKESCPHCRGGAETFRYMGNVYRFDIDLARQIINDGREKIELEPDDVRFSVDSSRIYEQHLEHVDTQYPGIIAHIWYPEPDGTILQGHVLIDGHHRAARCLQLGIPYYVQILSEEESRVVLLEGPDAEAIAAQVLDDQARTELIEAHDGN